MKVEIKPGKAKGVVIAPPSKSMAHRLLISAALANHKSVIHHLEMSEDIKATLDCLEELGATYQLSGDSIIFQEGLFGKSFSDALDFLKLNCRESGSTLRFLIPLSILSGKMVEFRGAARLFQRPLSIYENNFSQSAKFFWQKTHNALRLQGQLEPGIYTLPGNISSQFVSGYLFALPLLETTSQLIIKAPVESFSYIAMTIATLQKFGIKISTFRKDQRSAFKKSIIPEPLDKNSDLILEIQGGQQYMATECSVEGDYSNAAFFAALNLLEGEVEIRGLDPNSLQGDRVYESIFSLLKAHPTPQFSTSTGNFQQRVQSFDADLKENPNKQVNSKLPEISLADCPDLGPIAYAMAAATQGAIFRDTKRLALKESNRNLAMATELLKFGVEVKLEGNAVRIENPSLHAPTEELSSHNDHRIAMALAILATKTGACIKQAEAINKSFPAFFDKLAELGIEVIKEDLS